MSPVARLVLWLCIVLALLVDLLGGYGPLTMLSEHLVDLAQQERRVSEVPRAYLWRRGQTWEDLNETQRTQALEAALKGMRDDSKLRDLAGKPQGAATLRASVNEVRSFVKMLEFDEDRYRQGLQGQGINEAQWLRMASQQLHEQAWLEAQLPPSMAETGSQAWFEAHRAALQVPTCYHAAHLFLSAHEKDKPERDAEMQSIAQQLQNGAAIETLAAQYSEDERTKLLGGDLGWFTTARMPGDFMAAVTKLKPGETSGVVRTKLGWHVIKLLEIKVAAPVRYDDVKTEIVAMLANQERAQAVGTVLSK